MGLFDWLARRKQPDASPTRVWLTKAAKYEGILQEIHGALSDQKRSATVLLIAHFANCLQELEGLVDRFGFTRDRLYLTLANDLPGFSRSIEIGSGRTLFLVAEKHPLRDQDQAIVESARSFSPNAAVVFHVSLDDAVMRLFAGEWLIKTLRQLGMKEDEVIENVMVARQLQLAQKKIAEQALGDAPADSADEWLQRNYQAR